eukprot:TRINITY_DN2293_c0_g1_i2.p1 TRINITY_DN2293_c0_g1~~TRINITY_DN2293_c0_g1_i2.p1  ORF type:complete len:143 (-),score=15.65 TRINITY_DN2293_c0_g1_i2:155-583(-)
MFDGLKERVGTFGYFSGIFGTAEEEESCFGFSWKQRIFGFIVCLAVGLSFCFLSTFFLLSPRQFAKFYTLGSLFLLSSTLFLVGPKKQLKNMFSSQRYMSTTIYLASLFGTLYTAIILQHRMLTFVLVIIQFGAAVWLEDYS